MAWPKSNPPTTSARSALARPSKQVEKHGCVRLFMICSLYEASARRGRAVQLPPGVDRKAAGPADRGAERAADRRADRRVPAGDDLVASVEACAEGLARLAAGAGSGVAGLDGVAEVEA